MAANTNPAAGKPATGYILYAGPSMLDGSPIVAIAIVKSSNVKTGNMVQTYIIRSDVGPVEAIKSGADVSVCGDCAQRPINGGACYVNVGHGPRSVFAAFQRGNYPEAQDAASLGAGRMVRLGTYGDPAAVPAWIWAELVSQAQGRTGYTHQWDNLASKPSQQAILRDLVMASADNEEEATRAHAAGWRTFRVRAVDQALKAGEFSCPASEEAGKRLQCHECGACDGAERGAKKASVSIIAHGSKARRFIAIAAV